MASLVHIGEGAKTLGVTTKHLKVLERQGRIPPARRDGFGDRVYTKFDLDVLQELGVGQRPRRLKSPEEILAGMR